MKSTRGKCQQQNNDVIFISNQQLKRLPGLICAACGHSCSYYIFVVHNILCTCINLIQSVNNVHHSVTLVKQRNIKFRLSITL